MADLTVDPSQVQSISVDPSEVSPTNGQAASAGAGFLDRMSNQPLTSHTAATEAGLANVAQGVVQGVKGAYNTVMHPIDTVKGLAQLPAQAAQVPGAIKDINASSDPLGTYADVAAKTAGQAGGQALVAAATPAVLKGVGKAVSAVTKLRDVPAAISADTVSTLNNVATKEGLPTSTATTARDAAADLSKSFISRAKSTYKVVDDAVGGDLKPVQEKISSLRTAIRVNQSVNPDLADKYTGQLAEQQETLKGLVEKAKANGVPDADRLMDTADKDYSRGKAMEKVQKGVATPSGLAKMNGHPHPGGFANAIDRLERTGVLQKALGPEATDQLVQNAKAGLARTRTVGKATTAAKYIAGGVGAGIVGKAAIDALSGK